MLSSIAGINTADHVTRAAGQSLDLLKAPQNFDAIRRCALKAEQPWQALGATIGESEAVIGLGDGITKMECDRRATDVKVYRRLLGDEIEVCRVGTTGISFLPGARTVPRHLVRRFET